MSSDDQKIEAGVLLGMGNPLLDISATVDQEFLDKYGLKLNNAILAEEKHVPIYDDMVKSYKVDYIAGGATQNSIRVAQWMLQAPNASSFIGCIGKDSYGEQLTKSATEDGVAVHYLKSDEHPTGTCACLIKDKERSLCANLAAANHYKLDHLKSEAVSSVLDKAKFIYISGFFLTVSPETIMHVAKHAHDNNKTFAMNLSAPFIPQFFGEPLNNAMPYVDYLFGNESEAKQYGETNKFEDLSIPAIAAKIAQLPKENADRPRVVVITQGSDETIVAIGDQIQKFAVRKIEASEIVDSNGAGDAFVGGFLSQLIQGAELKQCCDAGNYAAGVVLRVSGTVLSGKPEFKAE